MRAINDNHTETLRAMQAEYLQRLDAQAARLTDLERRLNQVQPVPPVQPGG
jgi:hypothetical protein